MTGATGFVGRHLLQALRAADPGADLFGLVRHEPAGGLPAGAVSLLADLEDPRSLREALLRAAPERIFHLAGHAFAGGGEREAIFRANVSSTRCLLGALREWGQPVAVLLASSGSVYGRCDSGRPAREEDPLAPIGDYAESKAAMEALLEEAPATSSLRVVVTRAFNHIGPGQGDSYVVPAFARQIAEIEAGRRPAQIEVGYLESRRDFTDVRDVVRAYRLALEAGEHKERFNVCSGEALSAGEILAQLLSLSPAAADVRPDPARQRASDLPVSVGSPRKLEERTGWRREWDLTTTLRDVLTEWREKTPR
jgi:GDP-4-dehydro-6-deoxy-D-mannose reductase